MTGYNFARFVLSMLLWNSLPGQVLGDAPSTQETPCSVQKNKWGEQNVYIEKTIENRPGEKITIIALKTADNTQTLILRIYPINPQAAILDGYVTVNGANTLETHRVSQTEFTFMQRDGNGSVVGGIPLFTDSISVDARNSRDHITYLELHYQSDRKFGASWQGPFADAFFVPNLHEIKLRSGRIRCSYTLDREFAACLLRFKDTPFDELVKE